jgi:hypothetical protein
LNPIKFMHWKNSLRAGRNYSRNLARFALVFFLLWHLTPELHGQDRAAESSLKFAFLYNFSKFVEWPTSKLPKDDSPFIFGIAGDDPFGVELETPVLKKTLNGHPIQVLHVTDQGDARKCHILFVGSSEKKRIAGLLASVRGASVLTVGDSERFCQQGGMINFRIPENKVRFEINATAAARENLKVSSKLLSVALKSTMPENSE